MGRVELQAAMIATLATPAVDIDRRVSNLARNALAAFEDLAIDDKPRTDTLAG